MSEPEAIRYPPPEGTRLLYPPPEGAPTSVSPGAQPSLLVRAKSDDHHALATMFAQFLPKGEQVLESHYLGVLGVWGIGIHSFAAVTPRRIAALHISLLGGVQYNDGALEYINSAAVFQPSKVTLYLYSCLLSVVAFLIGFPIHPAVGVAFLLLSLLLLPLTVRLYYGLKKSGMVVWVREGVKVYAFSDRKRMRLSNELYRRCADVREERLRAIGHP